MNAWQKLLAASQLAAGTAWQLLSNPKTGIGGGIIVNDGVEVEVGQDPFSVEIDTMQIDVELAALELVAEIQDTALEVEVAAEPIEVEITE